MPKADLIQTNFTSGEWSPRLAGRVDLQKYPNSCKRLENFVLYPHGGITSRPGLRYIADAKYSDRKSRLIEFIFGTTQAYVLEFSRYAIRFFADGGQVMDGDDPYEIETPYTEANIKNIQWAQSADVMYLFHPLHAPRQLRRLDHTNWTLEVVDWRDGPYLSENPEPTLHIAPSGTSGDVTLRARYLDVNSTTGTWEGTLGTPEAVFTATTPLKYAGLFFTAPETAAVLKSISWSVASIAPPLSGAITMSCKLYSNNSGSPGDLLATSATTHQLGTDGSTGTKTFVFDFDLAPGTDYWVVSEVDVLDNAITLDTVAAVTGYGSGKNNTVTSVADTLTPDWKVEIVLQEHSNAALWEEGHVGALWRISQSGNDVSLKVNSVGASTDSILMFGKFSVDLTPDYDDGWEGRVVLQKSRNLSQWQDVASFYYSTKQEFFESEFGWHYRAIVKSRGDGGATVTIAQEEHWAVAKIKTFTSSSQVVAEMLHPLASTDPSAIWREGAWSDVRGWPKCVTFYEGRLFAAATYHQPQTFWSSWVDDFHVMVPHSGDNAAVDFTLLSTQIHPIQWLISADTLIAGTLGGEWSIRGSGTDKPIGPGSVDAKCKTTFGSAEWVLPVRIGPGNLFLQRARRKIRELVYDFGVDSYQAADLTLLSEHVTESGILDIAYQQEPNSIVWCVRADGLLVGLTYYKAEEVIGWHKHPTQGYVESVCCIPESLGQAAGRDELWCVVRREINGTTKRFIERMETNEGVTDQRDYLCLDSALSYSGDPVTTVSGLDHLEGETVSVSADGAYHEQCVVSDGEIQLTRPASVVHAGLPFTCTVETQKLEGGSASGTAQGKKKRIIDVMLRLQNTLECKCGPDDAHLYDVPFRRGLDRMDQAIPLFTGDAHPDFAGPWGEDGIVVVTQAQPFPITILAIVVGVRVND